MSDEGRTNDLRAAILSAVKKEASPTRPSVERRARVVLVVGAVAVMLVLAGYGGIILGERPASFVLHATLAWLAVFVLASVALLRRGPFGLGAPTSLLLACSLAVAPLLLASHVALHASEAPGIGHAEGSASAHVVCFALSALFSVAPFVFFAALRRGTDPVHPRAMGALAGAASAAFGGAMITLHCARAGDLHVALGHALPSAVLLLLGVALGPRIFGISRVSAAGRGGTAP